VYPYFLQSLSFRFLTWVDPAACCVGLPLTTWLDPCFIALSWPRQYSASVLNPLPMNQFPNLASIAACQCQFFVTIPRTEGKTFILIKGQSSVQLRDIWRARILLIIRVSDTRQRC
jgi:hypothetical protein